LRSFTDALCRTIIPRNEEDYGQLSTLFGNGITTMITMMTTTMITMIMTIMITMRITMSNERSYSDRS